MLILSRKLGESIQIGPDIEVVVARISGDKVRIGIQAPRELNIVRTELKTPGRFIEEPDPHVP